MALAGLALVAGPAASAAKIAKEAAPSVLAAAVPSAGPAPCPYRDPEDGGCFSSADEADLAWIARASAAPPRAEQLHTLSPTSSHFFS